MTRGNLSWYDSLGLIWVDPNGLLFQQGGFLFGNIAEKTGKLENETLDGEVSATDLTFIARVGFGSSGKKT